jgi:hypothetical protein
MFGLHETSRGSSYVPPTRLIHLSQLHKKGTLYFSSRKPTLSGSAKADGQKADAPKPDSEKPPGPPHCRPNPLPMKLFFAATAPALVVSTCTGFYVMEVRTLQRCGDRRASCGDRLPADLPARMRARRNIGWNDAASAGRRRTRDSTLC